MALAQDAIDLADALGLRTFVVAGHDWGARAAYTLAALFPERVTAIAGIALAYQPRGAFKVPPYSQARRFWYQWFVAVDGGASAVRADPKGFARIQWETWSPPGWFDEALAYSRYGRQRETEMVGLGTPAARAALASLGITLCHFGEL